MNVFIRRQLAAQVASGGASIGPLNEGAA